MTIRNYGAFDSAFAEIIAASQRNDIAKTFVVRGFNPDVDAIAEEDIWDVGGTYVYLTAASVLDCVSGSAEDNPLGSGIGYLKIKGLNAEWDMIEETVELNGLTPVSTTQAFIRVLDVVGSQPNAADPNLRAVGQIDLKVGTNIQAAILPNNTASSSSLFSIPRGYTGFFSLYYASGGVNNDFVLKFAHREYNDIFNLGPNLNIHQQQYPVVNFIPLIGLAEEKSDVKFVAQSNTLNGEVNAGYQLILVRNDYLDSLLESL